MNAKNLSVGIWGLVVLLTILLIMRIHHLSRSLDALDKSTIELEASAEALRNDARILRDRLSTIDAGAR